MFKKLRHTTAAIFSSVVYSTVPCLATTGATISTLISFNGINGSTPGVNGVTDASGNFYGTTQGGGLYSDGTLFEVDGATHQLRTLINFNQTNGSYARGGVSLDLNGNLYGTTASGGAVGSGTIYQYSLQSGMLTTLASFNSANGQRSFSGLVADAAGNLFGTTNSGGASGGGTIFELPAGSSQITALVSLNSSTGINPFAGLAIDKKGNLYGTAYNGGTSNYGTLFELNRASQALTTLVNFNSSNGYFPSLAPIVDSAGDVFCATTHNLFEIPAGASTAQIFDNTLFPVGMASDANGNIDLVTTNDIYNNHGSVIQFSATTHAFTVLGGFVYPDSTNGESALAFDGAGNLYGTRWLGGADNTGEVFELPVPEPTSIIFLLPAVALLRRRRRIVTVEQEKGEQSRPLIL